MTKTVFKVATCFSQSSGVEPSERLTCSRTTCYILRGKDLRFNRLSQMPSDLLILYIFIQTIFSGQRLYYLTNDYKYTFKS